jgi:glycerophosphoryl diester phosphodiesterase
MAFDYVIKETSYTDAVEFDVKLTKEGDDRIVIVHDDTINKVALPEGSDPVSVSESTYDELCNYNLGRNFVDRNGDTPYDEYSIEQAREAGLTMITLDDFLSLYKEVRDFKVLLEIKESDNERAFKLTDLVIEMLEKSENDWWDNRVMIITINNAVVDRMAEKYPTYHTGAIGTKIALGIIFNLVKLNSLYTPNFQSVQTKTTVSAAGITLDVATKDFIRSAHNRNQCVAYWTINDVETMRLLIGVGADIITTDAPDLLYETLQESK